HKLQRFPRQDIWICRRFDFNARRQRSDNTHRGFITSGSSDSQFCCRPFRCEKRRLDSAQKISANFTYCSSLRLSVLQCSLRSAAGSPIFIILIDPLGLWSDLMTCRIRRKNLANESTHEGVHQKLISRSPLRATDRSWLVARRSGRGAEL